ncbi:MAG TPA: phosphoglycolate phosphatase [Thermoplasmataceae archaeon]|nr:phosphoglycolate phosphatase [Thermoplasmatales archaeon AK]HLH85819.1 phosphoglycolate phosphatase [Thermoplasmataceae archaeon]
MIKLVLMDVDGTITDRERRVSTEAVNAIRKAQRSGIMVSLVSGNVIPVMYALKTYVGIESPVFGENGGIMLDGDSVQPFFDITKPRQFFDTLLSMGLAQGILTNRWRETSMGYAPAKGMEDRIVKMAAEYDVEVANSGFSWHILNRGQDKGFALSILMRKFNLKHDEIAVIGDSFNDLPMFKDGVVKAVPSNAEPELRKIANLVSERSHGKGTAELLLRIVRSNQ